MAKIVIRHINNQNDNKARRVSGFVPGEVVDQNPPGKNKPIPPKKVEQSIESTQEQSTATVAKTVQERFTNDGRYSLLSDLPTGYKYYSFSELWIRPFTPNEARLLHMARISGNLTYIISAVAACISQKISDLIIEDFEFCLYWLRMNSYPNRPFGVTWTCDNEQLDPEIKESKRCKHVQTSIINKTNLMIVSLDKDFELNKNIKFPTIAVFEDVWSLRKRLEALDENDPDFETNRDELLGDIYLMNIAQWVPEGESGIDKLELLKNAESLGYQEELENSISLVPDFGVSENIKVQCEECGGETKRRLRLDYLTFFP
jgi:hypothetical protein